MIFLENITLEFGDKLLFQIPNLSINKGEKCALIGRNGSGKSSLIKIITKELSPTSGSVSLSKNYRLGTLNQHIIFTKQTCLEEACLGLKQDDSDSSYIAKSILLGLGFLESDFSKCPTKFSGGYQLRLQLAKVLIAEPDCLLLDEPTNYLDILALNWLKAFLKNWKNELVIISHERSFIDEICSHMIGIHRGKIRKFAGNSKHYFSKIIEEESVYEKTREKLEKKKQKAIDFAARFGAKATKAKQAQSKLKQAEKEPALTELTQIYDLEFSFPYEPFYGQKMLQADAITFSYTERPLIENFSIFLQNGDKVALVGENGKGKSTLLRLLSNDLCLQKGSLFLSPNVKIGYFGQTNIQRLDPEKTVIDEIAAANPDLNETQVRGICGIMMFTQDESQKLIKVLSGGEKSRVLIGKIIASKTNILFLDEPTHHLDIESIQALVEALENYEGTIIMATHSQDILQNINWTKIIYCKDHKQHIFSGNFAEFLEKEGFDSERNQKSQTKEKSKATSYKRQRPDSEIKKLEKKIVEIEKQIKTLETLQAQELESLHSSKSYETLYRKIDERQKLIDSLYLELEKLFSEI